ncbi:DMT family transporter [Marinimicrobium sp. ABcell2]|uniref:DMT family transporter n=1 Tax=Marinimicrobium sp. ABcell2 TaxID=3069751 RepID=UPI0027B5E4A4|nr:DMT family transporter [Marinimicrobium sp. ABcell2]MDQ2077585.1 DMT family transporter [Marinimicrobium sp. ABcell2]
MHVYLAYTLVILIWSTTPLAIQWSSDSVPFMTAVALRMSLALALALLALAWLRRGSLFARPGAWKVYLVASLGIFPNMPLVYWSAQFIPSGLIAVIFALSPFVTGLLSMAILRENPFDRFRVLALLIALVGLLVIFWGQLRIDARSVYGIVGLLLSCVLFGTSSVTLKRLNQGTDAFSQTAGALLFALPGLLLTWWWTDGQWPTEMSDKTFWAVLYLAVFGSVLGFTLFYFVLNELSPSSVSLITLITPVLALVIGALVAQERLTLSLLLGAGLVIGALLVYLDLKPWLRRLWAACK